MGTGSDGNGQLPRAMTQHHTEAASKFSGVMQKIGYLTQADDVMYHAFEVCGRRYVPRHGVEAGSWPGVSSAGGITSNFGSILHHF